MPKLLIVDDNRTILELLQKELTQDNLQVETSSSIEFLWEYIQNSRPDLVLLGLHSEGFDSWQILNDVKKNFPSLPVLIYIIKSDHSVHSLRQAIKEVLKNGSISSAFMFHGYKKPRYDRAE